MMAEIEADLIVAGDARFEPDDVQREYGIVADDIWHIGEQIGRSIRKRDCNAWIISSGKIKGYALSECLSLLMRKVDAGWQGLQTLCALDGVQTQLAVAVYVYDAVPALDCSREVVRKLAELKADIDIDLTTLGELKGVS